MKCGMKYKFDAFDYTEYGTNCSILLSISFIVYLKKCKVVPVLNQLSTTPWRCIGEWMYRSGFTPRPLYPQGKGPWYPLDRRCAGCWVSWVGPTAHLGDMGKWKSFTLLGLKLWPFCCPACSKSLYRLCYDYKVRCLPAFNSEWFSEKGSIVQYSHWVCGTHETSQVD
jgi:hypothetical protein